MEVNEELIEAINNHSQAASYMLRTKADNGLEFHIDRALAKSADYLHLRQLMPLIVPQSLKDYQCGFTEECITEADKAIKTHGVALAAGQTLFHGGLWKSTGRTLTTSRPFSTSFCPQVAMRNGEWSGKAFNAGRLDLMVVHVARPKTQAYVYSTKGVHGNEKEVVFASGANLTLIDEQHVADITAYKYTDSLEPIKKTISAYVLEIELV